MKTIKLPVETESPVDPDTMFVGPKNTAAESSARQFVAEHETASIDPVLVALVAERERLTASLEETPLYAASRANHDALSAWLNATPAQEPLAIARLRAADALLEAETIADPESAKRFVRLQAVTRQLRAHRSALGLN